MMATMKTMQVIDEAENIAELMRRVGNVPFDRIRVHPAPGTAREADVVRLLKLPDKQACELVDGVLITKPMSFKKAVLNSYLIASIMRYLADDDTGRGTALAPWMPMRIRRGRIRIPDAMYLSWDRIPKRGSPEILNSVPEIVIDFILPTHTKLEMKLKLGDYYEAGVSLVWYVDPRNETITVYSARDTKTTLTIDDALDGGEVLPGFSLPLKKLFRRVQRRTKRKR